MSSQYEFKPYTKTVHRSVYPAIDPTNPANSAAGKVILITGGGVGIGKGFAEAFIKAGAKAVTILGRRENLLLEAKKEFESVGPAKVLTFKADVLDEDALKAAFEGTAKEVGSIDIVVANAGFFPAPAPAATADIKDWWKGFEINILGTLLTFRAWLPHKSSNNPVFISLNTGLAHLGAWPTVSGYAASKLGELHTVSFLQAENPDIRIVSMHPGVLQTEMSEKGVAVFSPDDMGLPASFAVWLASPAADWVGGRLLWSGWDVEELGQMKDEILANDELKAVLNGYPKNVELKVVP